MLRERPGRECQGNIKKGLLLSDCGEQKAVQQQLHGEAVSFYPWRLWVSQTDCATSPHPHQNNDASAKPMQSVSPFHSSCYRLPGKTHAFWPSRRFMTKLLATPSPFLWSHTSQFLLPYSSYSGFFLRLYMCSFLNITFTTNSMCRPSKYLLLKRILLRQCTVKECIPTSHLQTLALAVLGPCYIRSQQRWCCVLFLRSVKICISFWGVLRCLS